MVVLGPLALESNLCLAPLAGYTNLPFRLTIRELGGLGLATTDLVNARSLLERNRKALKLVETRPGDQPLAIQLFGADPVEMRDAAQVAVALGAAAIDINMGCPAPKVCRGGGGSAMMADRAGTVRLARGVVEAVRVPVTAKMRLGWDDRHRVAPELARALEEAGVAAVFVHGRTRQQGFSGAVNLEGIGEVVRAVRRMPVFGNGDVTTPEGARRMLTECGCAGVSIGRGAFYNPWIFRQTCRYLATGEPQAEPGFEERVRVMSCHLDRMIEIFGERRGCVMFRKIGPWYARRFGPSSDFKKRIVNLAHRAEFDEILAHYRRWRAPFLDEQGELLPRYRPAPMPPLAAGGFAEAEPVIPVPRGPVARW
ncbi:MAG TPA: tRNA dihydrouridine synthase DusB [Verrucomicrobiota bacterium]|nr:tRNA dihydrouridine synthase DusB [Verrucomicrobiota bacterium]HNU49539.1 tRNA dihydrouridine synthase DusB [Verrucomicrobiota bacterium]